jgi:hypothetical protein
MSLSYHEKQYLVVYIRKLAIKYRVGYDISLVDDGLLIVLTKHLTSIQLKITKKFFYYIHYMKFFNIHEDDDYISEDFIFDYIEEVIQFIDDIFNTIIPPRIYL